MSLVAGMDGEESLTNYWSTLQIVEAIQDI